MAAVGSLESTAVKTEKRSKKEKSEKKRAREEDGVDASRKHKKSKSVSADAFDANGEGHEVKEKKKSKKEKKIKREETDDSEDEESQRADKESEKKKKKKQAKVKAEAKEESSDDESNQIASQLDSAPSNPAADAEAMDVDEPTKPTYGTSSNVYQPADIPHNPQFPFFSQTVSLYEPIYPVGWEQPVTSAEFQYLRHLLNRYVPSLRGVLMSYTNVTLGPNPNRKGAAKDDESPTTLLSRGEYAVGYGWITADVELFVPSRGAWMEGSVNLQTEGHIGVVCFGKFNASIEARRLPRGWKWISNDDPEAEGIEETGSVIAPDEHGVVRQINSTGFWVDDNGDKVKGKLRFRIRNFDVGVSGETTYLSLEGTMLDKKTERVLVKEEAEAAKARKSNRSGRVVYKKRAPEFSTTTFMSEEDAQRQGEARAERAAARAAADAAENAEAAEAEGTKIVFED
ncbi:hypothetical protein VHEMI00770 [[Torrubiella] hemipterigena]|uniref:DNA-directed RNA polymerase subunit n=1 Tax=[Torrubiella] hemipterigena TaxID=1531966 RepID=A0A0A1T3C6_9HYPO|nr:hypothetical protein VHEMI00770 [[Torrubiella] hemipterigena]